MSKPLIGKVRVNLYMQAKLYAQMVDIANRDDRTMADLIRESCREYVIRDKRRGVEKYFEPKGEDDE